MQITCCVARTTTTMRMDANAPPLYDLRPARLRLLRLSAPLTYACNTLRHLTLPVSKPVRHPATRSQSKCEKRSFLPRRPRNTCAHDNYFFPSPRPLFASLLFPVLIRKRNKLTARLHSVCRQIEKTDFHG